MSPDTQRKNIDRRTFIKRSSIALAGISIVPAHVVSGLGHVTPSDKLNIAGIGVGGMGRVSLEEIAKTENIIALCDVDWSNRVNQVFDLFPGAKRYKDYRIMLDSQPDIDAVIVATPDHTHAVISMEAIKRGKHVYTEKPLAHTIYETRQLTKAAKEQNVATQMGNQGQADEEPRRLREMIWDGAIGDIHQVYVWTNRPIWPQGNSRSEDTPPIPESLDWDLFIGPAPMRPYHPDYHPFAWRGWRDFGTGALGDIGCHSFDPIFRALKLSYPTQVQAECTHANNDSFPLGSIVNFDFPARENMPALRLSWYDGGLRPPRIPGLEDGTVMGSGGTLYVGSEGMILNGEIVSKERRESYERPDPYIPPSKGHRMEWLQACKGGDAAGSDYEWAGPLTEVVLLGNIALQTELREKLNSRSLKFNPDQMNFPGLPEADRFLHYEYRDGWIL